ncbi:MAG: leucine-rich repeat protein, partial [Kordia sp.]|uniref:leucine-rich repeat protein n=1 Tax=Kordia sp. TaxID=1965332 RepID=UPI00385F2661
IPSGTVTIGNGAFLGNQIATLTLPNTVDLIDREAFRNNQLTSLAIPAGVVTIGRGVFQDNMLTNVTFPATVETIDTDAFRNNQFVNITLPTNLTTIGAGAFRDNQLTSIVIPDGVTEINSVAFRDNDLVSVTLPANLQIIRNDAFRNNEIEAISFPESLTILESFSFRNNKLTSVAIPANITTIAANTFNSNLLTSVTIPSNITSIGNDAFNGNPLANIIADSATPATITASSFGARGAINVTIIPDQQTVIDDYVAAGWTGFGSVNGEFQIGAQFTVGDLRYEVTALNPNTVKVLNRVTTTQNISIPETVTTAGTTFDVTAIENNAFQNTDITNVVIGNAIVTIGNNAFQNAPITSITLPASVTTIGINSFSTVTLEQIEALGTTPATIDDTSFGARENIALTIPSGNETDYSTAGWTGFFTINGNGLAVGNTFTVDAIRYEVLTLTPNTLSAIGRDGTVPNGDYVFPELISRGGVDFTITTIGNSAFRNQGVQTISLPSTVTTIAFRAFRDNGSLRSTNIPANITSIGGEAFFSTGLTEIISESVNPPTISNGAINRRSNINLFIPQGTTQAYIDANWTGFKSIIESGTLVLEPKIYLQGASLNPNTGEETLMRDDLRVANLIPTTSPYGDGVTVDVSVFNATGEDAIVDWIFVELRSATDNTNIVEGRSALLQRDGDVVDVNGTGLLQFTSPLGNYFVAIKHRNHLGIMTGNVLSLTGIRNAVDFTDATNQITFGTNAQTDAGMPTDTVGMWSGNVNGDSFVQYLGGTPDTTAILSAALNDPGNFLNFSTFIINGYSDNDVNMSGTTQYEGGEADSPLILQNVLAHPGNFLNFSTFQIHEQLPNDN